MPLLVYKRIVWFQSCQHFESIVVNQHRATPRRLFNSMAHLGRDAPRGSGWLKYWDVLETVAWVESNCFKRVTLQFPDELLAESTLVAAAIQHECVTRQISTQVSG